MLGVLLNEPSAALPRFASRTGAKCQSCHVNPSGGGMRQIFGVQYGRDQLPVPTWSEDLGLEDFSTNLTEFVSVGADFRTLYFVQESPTATNNAFWEMQGDVYLNFKLAKKVSIYLDKGLYQGFEIFGLLNILPANGHVKLGRFLPNYGMKLDDHRAFTRFYTGLTPEGRGLSSGSATLPGGELTGAEVAVSPGSVTIMGGVYNASDSYGSATTRNKALLGRAEGMFQLTEQANLGLGVNVFTKKNASGSVRTTLFGGFGSLSYQNVTVLGEVDLIQHKLGGTKLTELATFVEIDYVVTSGLDLKIGYDFYDPNKDLKTGSTSRYSIGLEFFPIAGVEVRPIYRIVKDEPIEVKNNEFNLVIHFYL